MPTDPERMTNRQLVQEVYKLNSKLNRLIDALVAIYSDSQLPKVVKEFYSKQIEQALSTKGE